MSDYENLFLKSPLPQKYFKEVGALNIENIQTQIDFEFNTYLAPMYKTPELYNAIHNTLLKKYFASESWHKCQKIPSFNHLIQHIKTINDKINVEGFFSYLSSIWIIHSFYDHIGQDVTYLTDNDLMWKSRHSIINNLSDWLNKLITYINENLNIPLQPPSNEDLIKFFFVQLTILSQNEVILTKTVIQNNKSIIFISCGKYLLRYSLFYKYKIFLEKPNLIQKKIIYYRGYHYSSIFEIVHQNKKNVNPIILQNTYFLEKLTTLKYYIDWDIYDEISNLLEKNWLVVGKTLDELFIQLKIMQSKHWDKLTQRYANRLYMYIVFWKLKELKPIIKNGFYLIYYIDFRGRLYSDSIISPIGNRIFRYLYNYGVYEYSEMENFKFDKIFLKPLIVKLYNDYKLYIHYPNINLDRDYALHFVYTAFLEMGKITKHKYINKFNGKISLEEFIIIGAGEYLNAPTAHDNFETHLEYLYVKNILNKLNNNTYTKIIIYKDATASAIQLLMLLLGPCDLNKLKYCNLIDNNYWYDTYYFIIAEFLNKHSIDDHIKPFFVRKFLKKTIMTYNYNATLWRCWGEFLKEVNITDKSTIKQLKATFQLFFNFLKNLFETNQFYSAPSNKIIEFYKTKLIINDNIIYSIQNDVIINLEYYKITEKRIDKIIDGARKTLLINKLTGEIDEVKTLRALKANIIHSLDGVVARSVILYQTNPTITIHDSYSSDILKWGQLSAIIKYTYTVIKNTNNFVPKNENFNYDITSDFVII